MARLKPEEFEKLKHSQRHKVLYELLLEVLEKLDKEKKGAK